MISTPQISGGKYSGGDLVQKVLGGVSQLVLGGMVFSSINYATITEATSASDSCDATVTSFTGSSVGESASASTIQDAATVHLNSTWSTLDPANKSANIALSLANLKATGNNSALSLIHISEPTRPY